ncbi:MAG: segregation/condensation protein A [Oscillospiraceae bacterium]|nr:segregation/condensation protein A [Oscillospiraceae bacterium]
METLTFKLEQFEGPLDLLLHLITKHKLNLYDIQIDLLLEQYLAQMERIPFADLEAASDFLEMASRLVYMKSAMLLPRYEDEGDALKRELTGQLLEYQACKEAAEMLAARWQGDKLFCRPVTLLEPDMLYRHLHEPREILDAYLMVLGKVKRKLPPPKEAFSGIVKHRVVSVQSRIVAILHTLYQQQSVQFKSLFDRSEDRSEMVATFLAVLELVKSKRIVVDDEGQVAFGQNRTPVPEFSEEDQEEDGQ